MGRCVRDWWEETAESVEGGTGLGGEGQDFSEARFVKTFANDEIPLALHTRKTLVGGVI